MEATTAQPSSSPVSCAGNGSSGPSQLAWRLYDRFGQTWDSGLHAWDDPKVPCQDVVAVVWRDQVGEVQCEYGAPYYWHAGDWIRRVWDPTLYLRQAGLVKFGRWAGRTVHDAAWRAAMAHFIIPDLSKKVAEESLAAHRGVLVMTGRAPDTMPRQEWWVYYDDGSYAHSAKNAWAAIPSDGVLAVAARIVINGAWIGQAVRRVSYYLWTGIEVIGSDSLDEVLKGFPQCKRGCPTFTGPSFDAQHKAIETALHDRLEDLR